MKISNEQEMLKGEKHQEFNPHEYIPTLIRMAVSKGLDPHHEAPDIAHDAYLKYMQAVAKGTYIDRPEPFISKILTNCVNDYYRKRKRKPVSMESDLPDGYFKNMPESEDDSEEDKEELIKKMLECIDQIDESDRQVLMEKYIDELSIKSLAEKYKITESAMKMRITRARQRVLDKTKNYFE